MWENFSLSRFFFLSLSISATFLMGFFPVSVSFSLFTSSCENLKAFWHIFYIIYILRSNFSSCITTFRLFIFFSFFLSKVMSASLQNIYNRKILRSIVYKIWISENRLNEFIWTGKEKKKKIQRQNYRARKVKSAPHEWWVFQNTCTLH